MKSLKIAALGVAALGFAALPVAGAFAVADYTDVNSHVDKITLTVDSSCTLGTLTNGRYDDRTLLTTDATEHADGTYDNPKTTDANETLGTWDTNESDPQTRTITNGVRTDNLTITMQPGTKSENIGSTTFTVRCNNAAGYELKAKADDSGKLKKDASTYITTAASSAANSFWGFRVSAPTGDGVKAMAIEDDYRGGNTGTTAVAIPTSLIKIAGHGENSNIDDGEKVTVTYGAGISKSQESGTYTGSVTYTLVALNNQD